jgi:phosphatidate cytidylyltransferase
VQKVSEQNNRNDAHKQADRQWFRSVGLRFLSAAVGIPIVLVMLWLGGWWAFATALVVTLAGIAEMYLMLVHEGYRPVAWLSGAFSLLFLLSAMFSSTLRLNLLSVGLSAALLVSFPVFFFRKKLDGAILDWALTLASSVYLGWPMSLLLLLRGYQAGWSIGVWWLLAIFGSIWGCDTGAFFAGHFWGKHKLAPHISPGKTWEGVFGGLIFALAAGVLFVSLPLHVSWYLGALLGLLTGVAGILGDLAESLLKRQMHVKDSGKFFPGHGGMLDRIDSLLFGVLVVYLFALLIGKV